MKRFCEIQEDPPSLQEMTYERLKQIVVSYPELSKCPELKVGARCYLGEPPFRTLDGMPGAEASFSEIKVSCNYAISSLSPLLQENPFRKRICHVFSADNSGSLVNIRLMV